MRSPSLQGPWGSGWQTRLPWAEGKQRGPSRLYSTISTAALPPAYFGKEKEEVFLPLRLSRGEGVSKATMGSSGGSTATSQSARGDELLAPLHSVSPPSALWDREWRGGTPEPGAWWAVGTHQPPHLPGAAGTLAAGARGRWGSETPENRGVGEGGWEEAQGRSPSGSQLREEWVGARSPALEAEGKAPGWRGHGRPPLVLGKAGVCGSWGLRAPRLAGGRVGVLDTRSLGYWG